MSPPVTRSVYWNGKDLPEELRVLPAGTYIVTLIDEVPPLTDEEDAGLVAALGSLEAGKARTLAEVQEAISRTLSPRPPR